MNFRRIYESANGVSNEIDASSLDYLDEDGEREITKEEVFQEVYENKDMIDCDEHWESVIDYLQDSAWDEFEGYTVEEFEDEFSNWFIAHSSFDDEDELQELFDEYGDEYPGDRF